MSKPNTFWQIILAALGEFFLILDAGYVGYSMEHGIGNTLETHAFWILLILGISLKFKAEKMKSKKDTLKEDPRLEAKKDFSTNNKRNSVLIKSLTQTALALFFFAILLSMLWLISYFIKEFLQIQLVVSEESLNGALAILATIGIAIYIYNLERAERERKQIDLLRILHQELIFLEKNLESYKETFSKEKHYPLYELWSIDISVYFNELRHTINNKETLGLKMNLMKIKDKILLIVNMKSEVIKEERSSNELRDYKIKSLKKGIIDIIDKDLLPIIKESKKILGSLGLDNP